MLGQLAQLAERERLAVVENAHLNKSPSNDPYLRINGSTAFYNAARSVLTVTRDPADPDWQRLVAHHKSNYGPLADVERWRVEPVSIFSESGPIETMKMEFVEIAEGVSREDVLATHSAGQEKLDEAVAFLEGALADGEWHDSAGLIQLARHLGADAPSSGARGARGRARAARIPVVDVVAAPQSCQALSRRFGMTGRPRMNKGIAACPGPSHAKCFGERRN